MEPICDFRHWLARPQKVTLEKASAAMVMPLRMCCIVLGVFALVSPGLAQDESNPSEVHASIDPSTKDKAEAGDRDAQNEMGLLAQDERNYAEALKWFKRAADQGLSKSQVSLGFLYGEGLGVKADHVQAFHWYSLAAAQGDPDGEFDMGMCYHHGDGVKQNPDLAIKWFTRALNHGDDEGRSANGIGLVYETRPHDDQNKDYAQAFRWYRQGAEMGFGESQYNVCRLAAQGLGGVTTDYHDALKWCSQLAERDDESSYFGQYGMGRIYEQGLGVPQNSELAAEWYRKGAEHGNTSSQMKLATLYSSGKGVERDLIQAYKWAKIADSLNDPTAPSYLKNLSDQMPGSQISAAQELAEKWIKENPPDPERANHVNIDGKPYIVSRPKQ